jgi:hypothetical protein
MIKPLESVYRLKYFPILLLLRGLVLNLSGMTPMIVTADVRATVTAMVLHNETKDRQIQGCAGYLERLFAELGVLYFIKRTFLSKHTIGTYNHSGLESLAVLSFCLR